VAALEEIKALLSATKTRTQSSQPGRGSFSNTPRADQDQHASTREVGLYRAWAKSKRSLRATEPLLQALYGGGGLGTSGGGADAFSEMRE